MPTKKNIRSQFKQFRLGLSETEVAQKNKQIHDLLFSRIMMHRFSKIHTFLPIKQNNEVDTSLIINTLRTDFAPDLYIPKSYPDGKLTHHIYSPQTKLVVNKWGVAEPAGTSSEIAESTFDMVIVPLLAFDKRGFRVGYGGGYYDRFLSKCSPECLKVGLSFFEPVDEITDLDEHDVRLNHCVTPNKIWTFSQKPV